MDLFKGINQFKATAGQAIKAVNAPEVRKVLRDANQKKGQELLLKPKIQPIMPPDPNWKMGGVNPQGILAPGSPLRSGINAGAQAIGKGITSATDTASSIAQGTGEFIGAGVKAATDTYKAAGQTLLTTVSPITKPLGETFAEVGKRIDSVTKPVITDLLNKADVIIQEGKAAQKKLVDARVREMSQEPQIVQSLKSLYDPGYKVHWEAQQAANGQAVDSLESLQTYWDKSQTEQSARQLEGGILGFGMLVDIMERPIRKTLLPWFYRSIITLADATQDPSTAFSKERLERADKIAQYLSGGDTEYLPNLITQILATQQGKIPNLDVIGTITQSETAKREQLVNEHPELANLEKAEIFGIPVISILDTITSYASGIGEAQLAPAFMKLGLRLDSPLFKGISKTLEVGARTTYPNAVGIFLMRRGLLDNFVGKDVREQIEIDAQTDPDLRQALNVGDGIALVGTFGKVGSKGIGWLKNFSILDQIKKMDVDLKGLNENPALIKQFFQDFKRTYGAILENFYRKETGKAGKLVVEDLVKFNREIKKLPPAIQDQLEGIKVNLFFEGMDESVKGGYWMEKAKELGLNIDTLRTKIGNQWEATQTLAHEIGHMFESAVQKDPELAPQWKAIVDDTKFLDLPKKVGAPTDVAFKSYEKVSPGELFAEGMRKFFKSPDMLKAESPKMYDFMSQVSTKINEGMGRLMEGRYGSEFEEQYMGRAKTIPDKLKPLAEEAKKYGSFDEFKNAIGEYLYALNKKAKSYGVDPVWSDYQPHDVAKQKDLYAIKSKIINSIGEDTGELHQLNGGYGHLYRVGHDTFHEFLSEGGAKKPIYEKILTDNLDKVDALSREIGIEISPTVKDVGLESYSPGIKLENKFDYQVDVFAKLREEFGKDFNAKSKEVLARKAELSSPYDKIMKLEEALNGKAEEQSNITLRAAKVVVPPRENVKKIPFDDSIERLLRSVADNIQTEKQLTDLYNKATGKDDLLSTLTPRQRKAFDAGTPKEQKEALDYLRLKHDIETIPTFSEATKMIQKSGGYAKIDDAPLAAKNAYAAVELSSSLGLNEKYLYKTATENGIDLNAELKAFDQIRGEEGGSASLDFSNKLMDKLSGKESEDAFMPRMKSAITNMQKILADNGLDIKLKQEVVDISTLRSDHDIDTKGSGWGAQRDLMLDIEKNGVSKPLLVDQANIVLNGNHRLNAAKAAGVSSIPVIRISDADLAKIKDAGLTTMLNLEDAYESASFMPRLTDEDIFAAKEEKVERVIQYDKYNLPTTQTDWLKKTVDDLDLKERTVRSFDEMREGAQELLANPDQMFRDVKPGMVSDKQTVALKQLVNNDSRFIVQAENTLRLGKSDDPRLLQAKIDAAQSRIERSLQLLLPGTTEVGRALVSNKIFADRTMDFSYWSARAQKLLGEKVSDEKLKSVLSAVRTLTAQRDTLGLASLMNTLGESTFIEKAITVWKAGLLTSPSTHLGNFGGNTAMFTLEAIKNIPASILDKAMSVFTGKRTVSAVGLSEYLKGVPKGWLMAQDVMKYGVSLDDFGKAELYKQTNFSDSPIGKLANGYTKFVFRTLGAEDKIFRGMVESGSLAQQAKVQAINEGLRGKALKARMSEILQEPTEAMLKIAQEDSAYATFNRNNKLSDAITGAKRNSGDAGKLFLESAAPFARTPTNVALATFDYTPAGFVKSIAEMFLGKQKAAALSFGRATTGSTIIALGALLAENGVMTGTYPESGDEKKLYNAKGLRGGDLLIGDKAFNMMRFAPFGNLLQIGASLYGNAKDQGGLGEAVMPTAFDAFKGITEQTFLMGLSSILKGVTDPEKEGNKYLSNLIGGMIPTVLGQLTEASDQYQRESKQILSKLQLKIPIWRQSAQPKMDIFGEPMETAQENLLGDSSNFVAKALLRMFDPTQMRQIDSTHIKLIDEYQRLSDIGIEKAYPSVPSNKGQITITLDSGEKRKIEYKMDEETYNIFQELTGKLMSKAQEDLISLPEYQALDDNLKAKNLYKIYETSRDTAKSIVMPLLFENNPQLFKDMKKELSSAAIAEIKVKVAEGRPIPSNIQREKLYPRSQKVQDLIYNP